MSKELKGWENLRYLLLSYSTMTTHTPLQLLTCQLPFLFSLPSPVLHHQVLCFLFHCLCPFLKFFLSVLSYTTSLPHKALFCAVSLLHPSSEIESCSIMSNSLPPSETVHGILHSRTLEWVAIPFSRDLSNPGIEPRASVLQADSLPTESPRKPQNTE